MYYRKLNERWKFWKSENSFSLLWDVPEEAKDITLPHDAMQENSPFAESKNGSNTGYYDGSRYCYVRNLYIAKDDPQTEYLLKFEGVYTETMIYVNEQFAGQNTNGYSVFYVPISSYLQKGKENEIRVYVNNDAMTNSRWYTGSGIYRDIYLLTGGPVHIREDGVKVETKSVFSDYAEIHVSTKLCNDLPFTKKLQLLTVVTDKKETVRSIQTIVLSAKEQRTIHQRIMIPCPHTWDEEHPYLYSCQSTLYEYEETPAKVLDKNETTFGIRTLSVDPIHGLIVNKKSVKLRGACLHHDSGLLGAATYDMAQFRQIRLLKEAGFNAVRMAHHPMAPAMLRACDQLGVYVMDEYSDMWSRPKSEHDYSLSFASFWERDIEAMVQKDFNHPSVILYSIGNEIPEIGTAYGEKTCSMLSEKIRHLDPTRFTTIAVNGFFGIGKEIIRVVEEVEEELLEKGALDESVNHFLAKVDAYADDIGRHDAISKCLERVDGSVDIVGYNYMASRYEQDSISYPNRVIVGSETYPPVIARNWNLVKNLDCVIGDFTWTGWDYIGEAGIGVCGYEPGEGGIGAQFPCRLAYCGDIDITGFRRPASYLREIVFGRRKDPYIAVQPPAHYKETFIPSPWIVSDCVSDWSWPGYEGKPVTVEVYSAGDSVELYQNGQLIEQKSAGERASYRILFDIEYQPGTLEAISLENGKIIGRAILETTGAGDHYQLTQEEPSGDELLYIDISFCDKQGHTVRFDQEIETIVSGAHLAGFGSADPKTTYSYQGTKCKTWNGRALLILRKTDEADPVSVFIKAQDEKSAQLILEK